MYTFDNSLNPKTGKKKHLHMLDGKPLTGTTTVFNVIAKPMLIQWAANLAAASAFTTGTVPGLKEEIAKYEKIDFDAARAIDGLFPQFKQARTFHLKKKEEAGDWGTYLHAMIESYAKQGMAPPPQDAKMDEAFQHFLKWTADNKVEFLESEKNVYSREMWVGGICDLVVKIDGQIWLADVKTGSGIYPEHFWQMASYEMCLKEMGLHDGVVGYIVLDLKKDGTFEEKRSISNEENQSAFKAALTIYRIQEKIKSKVTI